MDRYGLYGNIIDGNSYVATGARALIFRIDGAGEMCKVYVRTRGGRFICYWTNAKNLTNLRIKTVPYEVGGQYYWADHERGWTEERLVRLNLIHTKLTREQNSGV